MGTNITNRIRNAWNVFTNRDPTPKYNEVGYSYSYRPDRPRLTRGNERSIINSIFNRIAIDAAAVSIKHCLIDEDGRYLGDMDSELNKCLNLSPNIDQGPRSFIQDIVMSLLDEGCVAVVPTETDKNMYMNNSFDIYSMRVGKILEWKPLEVRIQLYDARKGDKKEITIPKEKVAIIENPLFAIINEPNSAYQRLVRKLNLLDVIDEQSSSGKLDIIVQLPYSVKTHSQKIHAEERRKDIEMQLSGSKYGIAYMDATEKVTQLNRPVDNNLMKTIEYLTDMLYSQLGITQAILNGTATEQEMLNYYNRTIEPIIASIVDELKRKFLTPTARTQGQTIAYFRDPFKLVPINNIAEIADKFTRNEILTSNEIRQIIGIKPSGDPKADMLINSNIAQSNENLNMLEEEYEEQPV